MKTIGYRFDGLFDLPDVPISIAGTPICFIPSSTKKYRNFLEWWFSVGRLHPEDPQGFGTLSGPWVMRGRVEAISPEEWSALSEEERQLISNWAVNLPVQMFYD